MAAKLSKRNEFLKTWTAGASARLERAGSAKDGDVQLEFAPAPLLPFADMDYWYLTAPLVWQVADKSQPAIVIPKGFTTDFASVPRYLWSWVPPTGRHGYPALIHDWLYWAQPSTRAEADLTFNTALVDLGVRGWKRFALYRGVDLFGQKYWDENAALRKNGAGRILKDFPPDASITWAEWSTRTPRVFAD